MQLARGVAEPRAAGHRKARSPAGIVAVSLTILLVACSWDVAPSPSVSVPPSEEPSTTEPEPSVIASTSAEAVEMHSPPALSLDEVPLMCGSPLVFGIDALDVLPGAEMADHPAAVNLRQLMAEGSLPNRSGWRLVVFNDDGVLFLLPGTRDEGVSYWNAEFGPAGANWQPVRFGQCQIQPAFEGVEAARWELSPGQEIGPNTQSFEVRVFEQACASGASPEGRIVGPAVVSLEDSLIVILGTRPPPGPQTCDPGPAAIVRVELPEPLGDRQLLDGATFPPEPRT